MLKVCPLCGQKPNDPVKTTLDERWGYNFTVAIVCPKCKLTLVRESARDENGWCCDKGQAISALVADWNQRAPVTVSDGYLTEDDQATGVSLVAS